jgi:hypothetical protein
VSHKAHTWLLAASVAVGVAAIALSMAATVWYSAHLSSDRKAEQVAGCERANVQRSYINAIIDAHTHPSLALPPIPIPNCEEIIK